MKLLPTLLFLFIASTVCAEEPHVFTDQDLGKYKRDIPEESATTTPSDFKPASDIERTFKEQLDEHNLEIKRSREMFNLYLQQMKDATSHKYFRLADEKSKEADQYSKKLEAAKEKRGNLKIKVLENFKTLPSWWHEE